MRVEGAEHAFVDKKRSVWFHAAKSTIASGLGKQPRQWTNFG